MVLPYRAKRACIYSASCIGVKSSWPLRAPAENVVLVIRAKWLVVRRAWRNGSASSSNRSHKNIVATVTFSIPDSRPYASNSSFNFLIHSLTPTNMWSKKMSIKMLNSSFGRFGFLGKLEIKQPAY